MCKSCVRPVQTVLKNRGSAHIFCAGSNGLSTGLWKSIRLSTIRTHKDAQRFSTFLDGILLLSHQPLSTSSTRPITRTIIYT